MPNVAVMQKKSVGYDWFMIDIYCSLLSQGNFLETESSLFIRRLKRASNFEERNHGRKDLHLLSPPSSLSLCLASDLLLRMNPFCPELNSLKVLNKLMCGVWVHSPCLFPLSSFFLSASMYHFLLFILSAGVCASSFTKM